jgi:putative inorganic carbon (HCO3(-)) transporter
MTAELLVQIGAPTAGAGAAVLAVARGPLTRLAGLGAWFVGLGLFLPYTVPETSVPRAAAAAVGGVAAAGALAVLLRRWPWSLAFLALAVAPARIPVTVGDTSANLLLPLYAVVVGGALALGWSLWRDPPRGRELGQASIAYGALVLWLGVSAIWSDDVRGSVIILFFYVLPFAVLGIALARLPWGDLPIRGLYGLLMAMALVFAAVGLWQWMTRDVFWNPKVIVGNAYTPFYRVNSVFWDPSIYGRFLVVAILASLVLVLYRARPRVELAAGVGIAALWLGLLVSFSQSSFASLVAGVALAAALAWRWRAAAAVALVSAVMLTVGFAAPQLDGVRDNLFGSSAAGLDRATSGRFELVTNAARIALDHPVAGVGTGGFKEAYEERLSLRGDAPAVASHNTPLTVAAENGIVGLALLAWLLLAALLATLRGNRGGGRLSEKTAIAAGVLVAAIFVHSLFYNAFFEDPLSWGLLALGALAVRAREAEVR